MGRTFPNTPRGSADLEDALSVETGAGEGERDLGKAGRRELAGDRDRDSEERDSDLARDFEGEGEAEAGEPEREAGSAGARLPLRLPLIGLLGEGDWEVILPSCAGVEVAAVFTPPNCATLAGDLVRTACLLAGELGGLMDSESEPLEGTGAGIAFFGTSSSLSLACGTLALYNTREHSNKLVQAIQATVL